MASIFFWDQKAGSSSRVAQNCQDDEDNFMPSVETQPDEEVVRLYTPEPDNTRQDVPSCDDEEEISLSRYGDSISGFHSVNLGSYSSGYAGATGTNLPKQEEAKPLKKGLFGSANVANSNIVGGSSPPPPAPRAGAGGGATPAGQHHAGAILAGHLSRNLTASGNPAFRQLEKDTFSLMVFDTSFNSMICAVAVHALQLVLFLLILLDNRKEGGFGVPAQVSGEVKATGFLALIIAVLTQDDLRTSLSMWRDGYHPQIFETAFPGATKKRWFVSTLFRAVTGFLSLSVTLLLIVQSEDVLELLLNFTAIEVVSRLDDAAFLLAENYYFGEETFKDAAKISTTVYYIKDVRGTRWFRKCVLFVTFLVMMIIWSVAVRNELPPAPTAPPTPAPTTFASTCAASQKVVRVEFRTDEFPMETRWSISFQDDSLGRTLLSGGPYNRGFATFTEEFCVERNRCLQFEVLDDGGDGIAPQDGGYFALFSEGEEIARGGVFGASQTVYLGGACPCTICENGFLPSNQTISGSCSDAASRASEFVASDPQCSASFHAASVYCGCPKIVDPPVASRDYCRICGNGLFITPSTLDNFATSNGLTCLGQEIAVNPKNGSSCPETQQLVSSFGNCGCKAMVSFSPSSAPAGPIR